MTRNQIGRETLSEMEFRCPHCGQYLSADFEAVHKHYEQYHPDNKVPDVKFVEKLLEASDDCVQRCLDAKSSEPTDQDKAICINECKEENTKGRTKYVEQITPGDVLQDEELNFIPRHTIENARLFAARNGAKLYKFKTLEAGVTDNDNINHGRRTFNTQEKLESARTLIERDLNINHMMFPVGLNFIVDANFVNNAIVGLFYVDDPVINELNDRGLLQGVSVEFFTREVKCQTDDSNRDRTTSCEQIGVWFVGMAIVTVPFKPGDAHSQLVQVESLMPFEVKFANSIKKFETMYEVGKSKMLCQVREEIKHEICQKSLQRLGRNNTTELNVADISNSSFASIDLTANEMNELNIEEMKKENEKLNRVAEEEKKKNVELLAKVEALEKKLEQEDDEEDDDDDEEDSEEVLAIKKELETERKERLKLQEDFAKFKEEMKTGKGSNVSAPSGPSKEELKQMAQKKIEMTDFEQIVSAVAESKSLTVDQFCKVK